MNTPDPTITAEADPDLDDYGPNGFEHPCPVCNGTGQPLGMFEPCRYCYGEGYLDD